MKTISVSEAKASLSEYLHRVQDGEEVVITSRGKAVARLVPINRTDPDIAELESLGLARPATRGLAKSFWSLPRPTDSGASLRSAIADEREDTW